MVHAPEAAGSLSVLVVADDLTGATDSSVQFAHAGWRTSLLLTDDDGPEPESGTVSARVTDARALDKADAREGTRRAVSAREGANRLYLKIDSTMRGTVTSQIMGALDAWKVGHPGAFALVCSAYPAMGRTIVNGNLLVDGVPVYETAIGTDPVTPVTTSSIAELIPGSIMAATPVSGSFTRDSLVSAIRTARISSSVITVDAASTADLNTIAEAVAEFGEDVVSVGSAGLAAAMADEWGAGTESAVEPSRSCERVLIVASSLHEVTRDQIDAVSESRSSDVTRWSPTLHEVVDEEARSTWLETVGQGESATEIVIIDAPEERADPSENPELSSAELVAEVLAAAARSIVSDGVPTSFMLLGGEGARAVLNSLGAAQLRIHSTVREGIPIGTIVGGAAHESTVITKAGGFGNRTDVTDIAAELLNNNNEGQAQ